LPGPPCAAGFSWKRHQGSVAGNLRSYWWKNVSVGSSGKIADAPLKTNEIYPFGKMEEKIEHTK